jgi:hypothetical protein
VKLVASTGIVPSVKPRGHNTSHTYLRPSYFLVQLHREENNKQQSATAGRKKIVISQSVKFEIRFNNFTCVEMMNHACKSLIGKWGRKFYLGERRGGSRILFLKNVHI